MSRFLFLMLIAVAVLLGVRFVAVGTKQNSGEASVPTAEVERGSLTVTLPITGVLESAEETPVRSEIAGTLVQVCRDNLEVRPGDFIYQLDTRDLVDERAQLDQDLTDVQEALNTTEADSQTAVTQAESDALAADESLKLAEENARAEREKIEAQVKFAEAQTARAQREFERSRRLAELNYIAGTKLRQAEKTYRAEEFDLQQVRAQQGDTMARTEEQVEDERSAYILALHAFETAKADARAELEDAEIRAAEAQRRLDEVHGGYRDEHRELAGATALPPRRSSGSGDGSGDDLRLHPHAGALPDRRDGYLPSASRSGGPGALLRTDRSAIPG